MKASNIQKICIVIKIVFYTVSSYVKLLVKSLYSEKCRNYISRLIVKWSKNLLWAVKATCHVKYHNKSKYDFSKPTIIMCNHTSHYDIPVSFVTFPDINMRMIAKKELFKVPVFGKAMKFAEICSIDRKNLEQAKKDFLYAKQLLESGIVLWIAPEGTRAPSEKFLSLKKGGFITAMEMSANIIPMYIHNISKVLPPRTLDFSLNEDVYIHTGEAINANDYSNKEDLMRDFQKQWDFLQEEAFKSPKCEKRPEQLSKICLVS